MASYVGTEPFLLRNSMFFYGVNHQTRLGAQRHYLVTTYRTMYVDVVSFSASILNLKQHWKTYSGVRTTPPSIDQGHLWEAPRFDDFGGGWEELRGKMYANDWRESLKVRKHYKPVNGHIA